MILAVTGHRPNKLNNEYDCIGPCSDFLKSEFIKIFEKEKPEKVISGMALGVDTLWALTAFSLKIPVIAAVPFEGQDKIWPEKSKTRYKKMLENAEEVVFICNPGYASWKMQKRNEWMTDTCDKLIAVWNGDMKGGTYNCLSYAKKINKEVVIIDPMEYKKNG